MSHNEFGPESGHIIGSSLLNSQLIELNLSNNRIGTDSLLRLGEVIQSG